MKHVQLAASTKNLPGPYQDMAIEDLVHDLLDSAKQLETGIRGYESVEDLHAEIIGSAQLLAGAFGLVDLEYTPDEDA